MTRIDLARPLGEERANGLRSRSVFALELNTDVANFVLKIIVEALNDAAEEENFLAPFFDGPYYRAGSPVLCWFPFKLTPGSVPVACRVNYIFPFGLEVSNLARRLF